MTNSNFKPATVKIGLNDVLWSSQNNKLTVHSDTQRKFLKIWEQIISYNRVIHKVALSLSLLSPPIPLFQWYQQSNEIILNLSKRCWNLAFNGQYSRVPNYNSCRGRSSENICSSSGGAQEEGKTGWNSISHQNWWKN